MLGQHVLEVIRIGVAVGAVHVVADGLMGDSAPDDVVPETGGQRGADDEGQATLERDPKQPGKQNFRFNESSSGMWIHLEP